MIALRIEGGDKLARDLRALSSRVSKRVQRDALLKGGEVIRAAIASNAPRGDDEPHLADHIGISTIRPDDGSVGIAIGPTRRVFYGTFNEWGTSRQGARPFARPAFDSESPRAMQIIRAEIRDALLRRGIGSSRASGSGVGL